MEIRTKLFISWISVIAAVIATLATDAGVNYWAGCAFAAVFAINAMQMTIQKRQTIKWSEFLGVNLIASAILSCLLCSLIVLIAILIEEISHRLVG